MSRILAVDDYPENLYLLDQLLKGHGYEVATATNGEEALREALRAPPDLVVTDILMPVMDGFALCRAWMKDGRLNHIPLVFYTGTYTDGKDRDFALSLGAARFIVKPAEPEALLAELKEVLAAHETGTVATPATPLLEEGSFLRQYDAALIRKLEHKTEMLEREIRERRSAEEALRESESRLRLMVRASNIGLWDWDLRTNSVRISPEWKSQLGYADDEIAGGYEEWETRLHPEDKPRVLARLAAYLERPGSAYEAEFRLRHKDGSWRWIYARGEIIRDASGKPASMLGCHIDITARAHAEEQIRGYIARLEQAMNSTVKVVATIGELRDPYTQGHQHRVGEIACAIAVEMGLDANRVEGVRIAGYLHDVGKIAVPAEILAKPGKLTKAQFDLVKAHAEQSYEILKDVEFPWPVADAAWQHHERLDGSGYPRGLRGADIVLEARIIAVADVVESMSSHRPYRAALGIEKALAEIGKNRDKYYDAQVVDACLRLFREKGYRIPA